MDTETIGLTRIPRGMALLGMKVGRGEVARRVHARNFSPSGSHRRLTPGTWTGVIPRKTAYFLRLLVAGAAARD